MALKKLDKIVYTGCPWVIGIVLTVAGLYRRLYYCNDFQSNIMIVSGLICFCLFCIASIIIKVSEKE